MLVNSASGSVGSSAVRLAKNQASLGAQELLGLDGRLVLTETAGELSQVRGASERIGTRRKVGNLVVAPSDSEA